MTLEKAIQRLKEQVDYAASQRWIYNPVAWALYQVWKEADKDSWKKKEQEGE